MNFPRFFGFDGMRRQDDVWEERPKRIRKFDLTLVVAIFAAAILAYCAINSFYTVPLGSQALLFRFGRYLGTEEQGLHFKAPWTEVVKFDVQEIRRFEFGEEAEILGERYYQNEDAQNVMVTSDKMVTSDSKILLISWVAQWRISDPYQYFVTNNVESANNYRLISGLAEADFRKEVASMRYEDILTTGKVTLSANAKARITNTYKQLGVGIAIVDVLISEVRVPPSVQASYNEVETAKQAKTSAINEAEAYANKTIEEAKGRAQVAINNAEAYKVNKIADATAVSARLESLNEMYIMNPELVRTNLWYENIEDVLRRLNITFVDGDTGSNIFLGEVPISSGQR
ncbi:MAG: FtsH protease activity modulator HflK [Synergistaceae bacterium]|jgi:membrane protease subunit HflK|nr:FtsH protease activity modulator HflK [Synergistaceae bacterium]